MPETVALIGAGGKMGTRLTNNLVKTDCRLLLCEKAEAAVERVRARGLDVTPTEQAVSEADAVILAVPDALIGTVSRELVPLAKPGATILLLDPAAAMAEEVALREDLNYVVTHPCHPPLFGEEDSPEARQDFFGGVAARQDIVIALMQGTPDALDRAERLCCAMFAPVGKAHRITVEQMAVLEPAMAEVVAASAACLMREALEEAVKAGVPRDAALAFMMGHIRVPLAIAFDVVDFPFSDAAKVAIRWGTSRILRPDWRRVFEPESIKKVIREMLQSGRKPEQ
ncbi:MAG: phosphogluconate dehydrogenase C-terminal domain-containing protein [Armatimonadota bacterium]